MACNVIDQRLIDVGTNPLGTRSIPTKLDSPILPKNAKNESIRTLVTYGEHWKDNYNDVDDDDDDDDNEWDTLRMEYTHTHTHIQFYTTVAAGLSFCVCDNDTIFQANVVNAIICSRQVLEAISRIHKHNLSCAEPDKHRLLLIHSFIQFILVWSERVHHHHRLASLATHYTHTHTIFLW